MPVNIETYRKIHVQLSAKHITLVAVSKTKPVEDIQALYNLGQRDFGENYVQELADKQAVLPKDICWHFIGHLQSNKVRYITPFVHLIHGVDSIKLLKEINKQAAKINRVIDCLLQVHIAQEETKFGFDEEELDNTNWEELLNTNKQETGNTNAHELRNVRVTGLMGMASFTDDMEKVRGEFKYLRTLFDKLSSRLPGSQLLTLSMGMSSDYAVAIEEGSTMVRIGSLLFGVRNYSM